MPAVTSVIDGFLAGILARSPLFLGLYSEMPDADGSGGVEISGLGYDRREIVFDAPSGGSTASGLTVTLGPALEDWGTVLGAGIFDGNGGLLWFEALDEPLAAGLGNVVSFPAGGFVLEAGPCPLP